MAEEIIITEQLSSSSYKLKYEIIDVNIPTNDSKSDTTTSDTEVSTNPTTTTEKTFDVSEELKRVGKGPPPTLKQMSDKAKRSTVELDVTGIRKSQEQLAGIQAFQQNRKTIEPSTTAPTTAEQPPATEQTEDLKAKWRTERRRSFTNLKKEYQAARDSVKDPDHPEIAKSVSLPSTEPVTSPTETESNRDRSKTAAIRNKFDQQAKFAPSASVLIQTNPVSKRSTIAPESRFASQSVRAKPTLAKATVLAASFIEDPKESYSAKGLREAAAQFETNAGEYVNCIYKSVLENSLRPKGLPMLPISANSKKIWESMRWMVHYSSYELVNYKSASALNLLNSWQSQATDTVSKIVTSFSDKMKSSSENGTVDLAVVTAATINGGQAKKSVLANVAQKVCSDANAVRSLGTQVRGLIENIAAYKDEDFDWSKVKQEQEQQQQQVSSPKLERKEMSKDELKRLKKEAKEREKKEKKNKKAKGKEEEPPIDIASLKPRTANKTILQLVIVLKSFLEAITNLMNGVETLKYLQQLPEDTQTKKDVKGIISNFQQLGVKGKKVEEEVAEEVTPDEVVLEDVSIATFDELMAKLIATHDNDYLRTFITTYRSFSTPQALFDNLKTRYKQSQKMKKEKGEPIQVKIIIIFKYWVETQINDFDEDLITKLVEFIDSLMLENNKRPKNLKHVLEKKISERDERTRLALRPLGRLELPLAGITPVDLIMQYSASDIAEQLTLIDYHLYINIHATELLNQSWNSPKLKYRSPNVITMISRSTKLSWWVSSCLLCLDLENRVKLLEKIISICEHLLRMNNFNSLMSIIGGLGVSSVHRLRATYQSLSPAHKTLMARFLEIMSTDSSYKNYRAALKSAVAPVIPYIGISLTDLTFIETGNQDTLHDKINFRKRVLIHDNIQDLTLYQTSHYSIKVKDPLHELLRELPHNSNENELYNLSLFFEPRV